tara:strand:+ start:350 stop:502 length:153 start_codon:yes stop_codon:yes gene_type:complete
LVVAVFLVAVEEDPLVQHQQATLRLVTVVAVAEHPQLELLKMVVLVLPEL